MKATSRLLLGCVSLVFITSCGGQRGYQNSQTGVKIKRAKSVDCEEGYVAFKNTFYQHLRKDCLPCHTEGGLSGIPHSGEDSRKSYFRILGYTNFSNLDKSLIVSKGGNRHCLNYEGNCFSTQKDIKEQIQKWWDEGQKSCPSSQSLLTKPNELPQTLPQTEIEFQLSHLGEDFQGLVWSVSFQKSDKYFILSRPRLKGAKKGFGIGGVSIYLDGKSVPELNSWGLINARVNPGVKSAVLSSSPIVFDSQNKAFSEISFGFESLKPSQVVQCKDVKKFEDTLVPILTKRTCFRCHQYGSSDDSIVSLAKNSMTLTGTTAEQCTELLLRGFGDFVGETPLITMPFRGALGHPIMFPTSGTELNIFTNWAETELSGQME